MNDQPTPFSRPSDLNFASNEAMMRESDLLLQTSELMNPRPTNPTESNQAAHPNNRTIKSGETLWSIAAQELRAAGENAPTQHEIKCELTKIIDTNLKSTPNLVSLYEHLLPGMVIEMPPIQTRQETVFSAFQPLQSCDNNNNNNNNDNNELKLVPSVVPDYRSFKVKKEFEDRNAHHINQNNQYNFDFHKQYDAQHTNHKDLHGLHKLEHKVLAFGKKIVDDVNHWLVEVAATAFLAAKHEALQHGIHIHINSAGRTYGEQSRLYRHLHGHSPVAIPGTSNHETGLAIDVENWRQAKPYLLAHGFVHGDGDGPIKNDLWHFKYVGRKSYEA